MTQESAIDTPLPILFVLGRDVTTEDKENAQECLILTPPVCAIVHQHSDVPLAQHFTRDVIVSPTFEDALAIATEIHGATGRLVLVITDGQEATIRYDGETITELAQC